MSKVGFWLKGSTGKLAGTTLYKGANGETIQREIVSPSNPKTVGQNVQRVVMSTVGAAYSLMKAICDHSFEGVRKGQDTMKLFMSENIQKCRAAIEEMQSQGVAFLNMYSFVPVGMKHAFAPNQYLVAMGSLPRVITTYVEDATSHILYPTIAALANKTTYGDVISALNLKRGDQLTFCCVKQGNSIQESQFNFARVILDPTDPTTFLPLTLDTPFLDANGKVNMPSVRNEGSFNFSAVASGLRFWYEDLYTTEEDTVAAYCMQQCLDLLANGAQHNIYASADQYLNNAGEGGGQAASDTGGQGGGTTPSTQNFTISSATVNNNSMTVGSAKQVMCAEGETTEDLSIRVTFSNVGSAQSVLLFKGSEQIGTEHAINAGSVNFSAAGAGYGTYIIKVKNSDNSLVASGYSINVVAYSAGGGGYNPDDDGMGQD